MELAAPKAMFRSPVASTCASLFGWVGSADALQFRVRGLRLKTRACKVKGPEGVNLTRAAIVVKIAAKHVHCMHRCVECRDVCRRLADVRDVMGIHGSIDIP